MMKWNRIFIGLTILAWGYLGTRTFFVLYPIEPILAFWVVLIAIITILNEIDKFALER